MNIFGGMSTLPHQRRKLRKKSGGQAKLLVEEFLCEFSRGGAGDSKRMNNCCTDPSSILSTTANAHRVVLNAYGNHVHETTIRKPAAADAIVNRCGLGDRTRTNECPITSVISIIYLCPCQSTAVLQNWPRIRHYDTAAALQFFRIMYRPADDGDRPPPCLALEDERGRGVPSAACRRAHRGSEPRPTKKHKT